MDKLEKIAVLEDEMQAQVLATILGENGIPHIIRSYHDSALDGLFQASAGWGHVEAAAEHRDEILRLLAELSEG